jgi:trk system potassium uptake protein
MDIQSLKNILKLLSHIGLAVGALMLIPVITGIIYGEAYLPFLDFVVIFSIFNGLLFLMMIRHNYRLNLKEGILAVNLVWVLLGIAGAIPLLLYTQVTPAQAFFEAISGFTTTGATVYADVETLPQMILILRSLMHWIGGMGIIVLGIGLFHLINPNGSLSLFKAEASGIKLEKLTPKIKNTALSLWGIYMLLTLLDALLLYTEGMNLFDALNHAMSTISTGGFSTKNASLAYWTDNSWILWTTTFFMIVSGINFLAHLKMLNGDMGAYEGEETRWYVMIFIALSLLLTLVILLHHNGKMDFDTVITHAAFTIASIVTTTGFASYNYELWGQDAIVVIIVAMLIGGSAGSTAGGIKVIRWIILLRSIIRETKQIFHPDALMPLFVDHNTLTDRVVLSVYAVVTLFVMTLAVTTMYLFVVGYDAMTSFSTALACVGNIGPGFALSGPTQNYSTFHSMDLMVLSGVMIAGRLEFFTLFLLLSRGFWKKF